MRVLAELDERELHAAVLDTEAGHQLGLGLEDVEGHAVLGRQRGDQERHEGQLSDHGVEDEPLRHDSEPRALLGGHDHRHLQRAREHDGHEGGEDERQVVGNDLVHRAHRGE